MTILSTLAGIRRSPGDPAVIATGASSRVAADKAAAALGWLSLGLGLAGLLAPRRITGALGVEGSEALVRLMAVRELGAGLVCLSVDKEPGVKSRVAGDALDLLALSAALAAGGSNKRHVGLALAAVGGITLVDVATMAALAKAHSAGRGEPRDYSDRSGWPNGRPDRRQTAAEPAPAVASAELEVGHA